MAVLNRRSYKCQSLQVSKPSPAAISIKSLHQVIIRLAAYLDEYIFRFDISVEDAISVHVEDGLAQLVHVHLHLLLTEVRPSICSMQTQSQKDKKRNMNMVTE